MSPPFRPAAGSHTGSSWLDVAPRRPGTERRRDRATIPPRTIGARDPSAVGQQAEQRSADRRGADEITDCSARTRPCISGRPSTWTIAVVAVM